MRRLAVALCLNCWVSTLPWPYLDYTAKHSKGLNSRYEEAHVCRVANFKVQRSVDDNNNNNNNDASISFFGSIPFRVRLVMFLIDV